MSIRLLLIAAPCAFLLTQPALAAPGLGDEVYGATVEKGKTEAEVQYDSLRGGPDDGEDTLKFELSHGVTNRLRLGILTEFEREPGFPRKAEAIGFEAIYHLGKIGPIDVAAYGEYEIGLQGNHKVEAKLLLQHKSGPIDLRFNLVGKKQLASGHKLDLSYATSVDLKVAEGFEIGAEAFGDLGTFDRLAPHAEHFAGPVVRAEIEGLGPELELSIGYLFAIDKARDDTVGQPRIKLEMEF